MEGSKVERRQLQHRHQLGGHWSQEEHIPALSVYVLDGHFLASVK